MRIMSVPDDTYNLRVDSQRPDIIILPDCKNNHKEDLHD